MSSRNPILQLDPTSSYTIPQFQARCKLRPEVAGLVIMRIISLRLSENPKIHPDQIAASGAELIDTIHSSRRVAKSLRRRPHSIQVPGGDLISVPASMPAMFAEMFKRGRES